jgi:hypothetical protein
LIASKSSSKEDHVTIARKLNVKPGLMDFSPRFWKFSWRTHGLLLPLLHRFDEARTSDLDNCLKVLWCKALVGMDKSSPALDGGLAYDMLPSGSRRIVKLLPERFFPRLVHFIIELRTVYLDGALREEIRHAKQQDNNCKIRLVTLGAGYDTRSVKFLNMNEGVDEAWELDMSSVIDSKSIMLDRLQTRRPNLKLPNLVAQDLTKFDDLKALLHDILNADHDEHGDSVKWHTVFLVEGVLIYLKEENRSRVMLTCSNILRKAKESGSFLFADRIRKMRDPNATQIQKWLDDDGWELVVDSFCVHPGKARHMGAARVAQ